MFRVYFDLAKCFETIDGNRGGVIEMGAPREKYDDVRDMVFDTNPAMGVRLDDEFTEEEFNTMSPDGFARERLGW